MLDARFLKSMPAPHLRLYSVLTLVVALIAVGLYSWRLERSNAQLRTDTIAQAELRAMQLNSAIAEQTAATVRAVDFALKHVRDEYAEGREIESDVRTVYDSFPPNSIAQIGAIDADGYLAWSSVGVKGRVYLGDREHYTAHRDSDADKLFISAPVLGRASGQWSIQFSRPVRRKGRFAGAMVISLSPRYFDRSFAPLEATDVVSLLRADGSYLARLPDMLGAMGKSVPADRPFVGPDAHGAGTFRVAAAYDSVRRIYAWQRLKEYPVSVVIGLDEARVLDPVEREIAASRWQRNVGSGVVLVLAFAVSLLLLRAARQQQELLASERWHRGLFEKNTSVHLLIDPSDGRIVDANPAAVSYYGYTHDQLVGMRITDINCLPPEQVKAEMENAKSERRLYFNFRHRLASGEVRDVEIYSGPVEARDRTLLFSIVHDVTERRELERRLAASEMLHRGLFETMAEGVVVVREDGKIAAWNHAALNILGVDAPGLQGQKVCVSGTDGVQLPPEALPVRRAARGERLDHELFGVERPDGKRIWVAVSSRPLEDDAERSVLSFSDVTRLIEAEESLRLAQSVFEAAAEAIMVCDADNRIIAVNPAFTDLTGYPPDEAIGRNPSLLASGQHDAAFYAEMWRRLIRDGRWEGEIVNRRKDGRAFVEWLRITTVPGRPGHGRRYVALFGDITERKREADAIWHQANFDELTGLPNRKLLDDRVRRAIAQARRKHSTVALLFVDLDRFKPVNDAYGHAAGDDLLRQVARRLEHSQRDEDTVARLGGDEFVVLLPDLRVAGAHTKAAEKVLAVLSEPFGIAGHSVEISCSIGVAAFPADGDTPEALIAAADAAMYAAKSGGRSTWRTA